MCKPLIIRGISGFRLVASKNSSALCLNDVNESRFTLDLWPVIGYLESISVGSIEQLQALILSDLLLDKFDVGIIMENLGGCDVHLGSQGLDILHRHVS